MRAGEFTNSKLVIFDIDDTLVNTDTRVNVVRDGQVVKQLNSHDFTHYSLQPGEEFDFGAFRDAREFFTKARPIPGMIRRLKQDIATGNRVIMLTARSDFNDRDVFLDTFRQYGIDMDRVHVYRAGNLAIKVATEEKKKIILRHLLGKQHYDKVIMYDDSVPNLNAFLSLAPDYPWSRFYAWHVDPNGQASEYHRTNLKEVNAVGELSVDPDLIKRFTDGGWQVDGEGRDQIVMSKLSSNTVLKIVGQGSDIRQDVVRRYVNFFRANQRNPHFPRVGLDKTLRWNGKTYYVYTQERLYSLPGDEAVMDYLEQTMHRLSRAEEPDYDTMPAALTAEQVYGLTRAVDRLYGTGEADPHEFDLGNLANIMQRANGQLVIVDPLSDFMEDLAENFADGKVKGKSRPGRVKRAGASCKGSVTDLRARAKKYGGERGRMYHWCANMKSGRKK
jgi:hypothetical protein